MSQKKRGIIIIDGEDIFGSCRSKRIRIDYSRLAHAIRLALALDEVKVFLVLQEQQVANNVRRSFEWTVRKCFERLRIALQLDVLHMADALIKMSILLVTEALNRSNEKPDCLVLVSGDEVFVTALEAVKCYSSGVEVVAVQFAEKISSDLSPFLDRELIIGSDISVDDIVLITASPKGDDGSDDTDETLQLDLGLDDLKRGVG